MLLVVTLLDLHLLISWTLTESQYFSRHCMSVLGIYTTNCQRKCRNNDILGSFPHTQSLLYFPHFLFLLGNWTSYACISKIRWVSDFSQASSISHLDQYDFFLYDVWAMSFSWFSFCLFVSPPSSDHLLGAT